MKNLNLIFIMTILLVGCQPQSGERHYTQIESVASAPQASVMSGDPHAGLGIPPAMGTEQDPHAGLGLPAVMMGNKDPHAGLNLPMGSAMSAKDMANAPMMPTANDIMQDKLTWSVPSSWDEQKGNGMRLATFHSKTNPQEFDCSIVTLGGMAGGLEANITRWLNQISVQITPSELQAFIQKSNDNVYDFTTLQKDDSVLADSMIAAILTINEATVFVKMTGSIQAINKNKNDFLALVKSVKIK